MSDRRPIAEDQQALEPDYDQQPPPDIVAYNELRSCADLYRMFESNNLDIQPEFQRDVVWSTPNQTRFVDSLIKQLPIPSMCFSLDHPTQRRQVIDGLQRMTAIVRFLGVKEWRLSQVKDVDERIAGKTNADFRIAGSPLNALYQRVENLTIPVTVIRCNYSLESHSEYLFTIFHRLNTGGMRLNNQEIRNCVYSGELNRVLKSLDKSVNWRAIKRFISGATTRFRTEELILRFFSFYHRESEYRGSLARFLNQFMSIHRNPDAKFQASIKELFDRVTNVVARSILPLDIQKQGYSVWEAILVGIARNIDSIERADGDRIEAAFLKAVNSPDLSGEALQADLSGTEKVKSRLAAATAAFSMG